MDNNENHKKTWVMVLTIQEIPLSKHFIIPIFQSFQTTFKLRKKFQAKASGRGPSTIKYFLLRFDQNEKLINNICN